MHTTVDESDVYRKLREKAESHLQAGTTPIAGHWSMGVDALRLLHELSSNPNKAGDALKLLHELQVYQVELDLQNEEMVANERALGEELGLYRTLYNCVPLAYFVIDFKGVIIQSNLAAAELFGIGQDDMEGQRIDTFINHQNRPLLHDLLQRVAQGSTGDSCVVGIGEGTKVSRHLQIRATRSPEREYILLACCENASTDTE